MLYLKFSQFKFKPIPSKPHGILKCRCEDKTNLLVLVQDTVVKLTKRLVLHNKLYEKLRGFTYSIHTNTHTRTTDVILCMAPRLATVD